MPKVNIEIFLELMKSQPVIDVRSPAEFSHARIPGAHSVPLFTDDERKIVGTAYKQQSREAAIRIGLEFFGKKMLPIVDEVLAIKGSKEHGVLVHCWRGGMRSAAVAWLLELYGFKVTLLSGGYKAYRQHMLKALETPHTLSVIGGCTGGNKTGLLHYMKKQGFPVIDLEHLAGHKGSAFGNLKNDPQPSQEQFENLLAMELISSAHAEKIWIEGESQRLGYVNIPTPFFSTLRKSKMYLLEIPFEERLKWIVRDYGHFEKDKIINGILRIKKRLGGLETKNAVNCLIEDDISGCFAILLSYYDRLYKKSILDGATDREIVTIESSTTDEKTNFKKISGYEHE